MKDYSRFEALKPLQEKHCEMLKYLDEFCTENQIRWCMAYGSALGARRHGGPIPWDDDVDIYMTAQEYDRFRRLFREKGDHERFYLQETEAIDGMTYVPKLRMNNTTFIEPHLKNFDMHHGIFIDIFLLHECPPNGWQRLKGIAATAYVTLKRLSNRNYKKRKIVRPLMLFLRLFPRKCGFKTAYRQLYKWDDKVDGPMFADWEMYAAKNKWFLEKDDIFPTERVRYNDMEVNIPHKVEKYLENCYGDWQQEPDQKSIEWTLHAGQWSVDEDFRKYAPNVHDFSDERFE